MQYLLPKDTILRRYSYIEKLEMYAHLKWENQNMDPSRVTDHFKSVSGGTLRHFLSKEFTKCLKVQVGNKCFHKHFVVCRFFASLL